MSNDNSPAVCVWNVRKRSRKFLYPTFACCPFRWFEKVGIQFSIYNGRFLARCTPKAFGQALGLIFHLHDSKIIYQRLISLRIVGYHFSSQLTTTLNLRLIYFKII